MSETQQIIANSISKLSNIDRQIIKMKYWKQFSYKKIGEILKISASTAHMREKKVLRKLRLDDDLKGLYISFKLHYKGIEIINNGTR